MVLLLLSVTFEIVSLCPILFFFPFLLLSHFSCCCFLSLPFLPVSRPFPSSLCLVCPSLPFVRVRLSLLSSAVPRPYPSLHIVISVSLRLSPSSSLSVPSRCRPCLPSSVSVPSLCRRCPSLVVLIINVPIPPRIFVV